MFLKVEANKDSNLCRGQGKVESIAALVHTRRQADAQILVRALYEHVLTFCWLAIDPDERIYDWRDHAVVQRKGLHNDAASFGISVLTEAQYAEAVELDEIKKLMERADEVDAFWSERIRGFRPGGSKQSSTSAGSTPAAIGPRVA